MIDSLREWKTAFRDEWKPESKYIKYRAEQQPRELTARENTESIIWKILFNKMH